MYLYDSTRKKLKIPFRDGNCKIGKQKSTQSGRQIYFYNTGKQIYIIR